MRSKPSPLDREVCRNELRSPGSHVRACIGSPAIDSTLTSIMLRLPRNCDKGMACNVSLAELHKATGPSTREAAIPLCWLAQFPLPAGEGATGEGCGSTGRRNTTGRWSFVGPRVVMVHESPHRVRTNVISQPRSQHVRPCSVPSLFPDPAPGFARRSRGRGTCGTGVGRHGDCAAHPG